ncbi:MAG: O-succinylbenzoate synthase [Polyangiaceae bacterium]|nr:O-succinylbenzoate synthase [Polyangiaceae bacterium]
MLARARLVRWGGAVDPARVVGSRLSWSVREGLLLALEDDDGTVGLGEATPLPGFSPDTLAEAEAALESFDWGSGWDSADRQSLRALAPSARFAVETAALDLRGLREGTPLAALLGATRSRAPVPIGALAGRLGDDPESAARDALARGAALLKVKSSGRDLEQDCAALRRLRAALGPAARLRVDLGGALDVADVPRFLEAFAEAGVEAVEEPCSGRALATLGRMPIPWLADETLVDEALHAALIENPACAGLVLKPTVLGGLGPCLDLAVGAQKADKSVTITHAFEGPVARAAAAALALACGANVAGLDGHGALAAFPALPCGMLSGRAPLAVEPSSSAGLGLEGQLAVYHRAFSSSSGRTLWER